MTEHKSKIAIVGAGIGGLAAALALREVGCSVEVYEQAPAIAPVGAGIQLTPNASKAIRGFGIFNSVRQQSYAPEVGYNRDWDTARVTNLLPMGNDIEAAYGAPDLAMHRAVLHFALLERLPDGLVRLGKQLVGLDRVERGYRLSFADGSDTLVDAVIGADGIHSVVRETLFGLEDLCFNGRVAYRTTFPTRQLPDIEYDGRVKWWGPDRHVVSYLLTPSEDEIYYIAVMKELEFRLESWSAMGDVEELLSAFEGFHPRVLGLLGAAKKVRKWALVDRDPMTNWGEERIVLLGDACHPMPPYIAQGAAAAMEDAIVMARCVGEFGPDGIAEAFRLYEDLRRPRTARMQITARENTWMQFKTDADWVYGYDPWTTPLRVGPDNTIEGRSSNLIRGAAPKN